MKKIWKYAILLVALSALLCMSAFAADKQPDVANINGTAAVNSNNESFAVSYEAGADNAGGQYLIIMLAGTDKETMPDPTKNKILYVNQTAADATGKVVFDNVYPTTVEDSVIWLTGGANAVALASVKAPAEPQPTGVTVSGQVKSYNPGNATTLQLKQGTEVKYTVSIDATTGTGQVTQGFSFTAVATGTYDLVVTKAGHLTYTVTGVTVGTENVDLTAATGKTYQTITLLCGDINKDGSINPTDINIIYESGNYYKATTTAANPVADLNGDGSVNPSDINIIYQSEHYYKGTSSSTFAY